MHEHPFSWFPLWQTLKRYKLSTLSIDLRSAFLMALVTLPQAVTCALIAHLPLSMGIYSAIFGAVFGGVFGSSAHLAVGPTTTVAILMQGAVAEILFTFFRDVGEPDRTLLALQLAVQLTLIVGVLQLLAGLFKLDQLLQFVSQPVVVGYTIGVALALAINQLYICTAIDLSMGPMQTLFEQGWYLAKNLMQTDLPTLLFSASCLGCFLIIRRTKYRHYAPLIILGCTTLLIAIFQKGLPSLLSAFKTPLSSIATFRDVDNMGTLSFRIFKTYFNLSILNILLPAGCAIALIGLLETSSISRILATKSGQKTSVQQALYGLGMTNSLSSLFGSMTSSTSFSRSLTNYLSGTASPLSSIFSGILIAVMLSLFRPIVSHMPLAAIAAILLVQAFQAVNLSTLKLCLQTTRADALVLILTVSGCLFLNLTVALFMGIIVSICLYLKKASSPLLHEFTFGKDGVCRPLSSPDERPSREISIVHVEGELFFGAAEQFVMALEILADDPEIRVIVLRLKNAHHLDATACLAVQELHQYLRSRNKHLVICGIKPPVMDVLKNSGLAAILGEQTLFLSDASRHRSTFRAYQYARQLVAAHAPMELETGALPVATAQVLERDPI